ncbi:MAG: outer membrane protein assembly factor BamE, partial [Treponema sp.]|nr:outer membrane protein assembly factor BamE [Treponema sp.]
IKKIRIALSLVFPMIAIFGFLFIVTLAFGTYDLKYYKNPLADTKVSESFKPLNLPLLKEGMTKEEVLNLLGEPLSQSESCFYYTEENGKGWYDYFILKVYFENDAVVKIRKDWGYED